MAETDERKSTKSDVFTWLAERKRDHFARMHQQMNICDEWLAADEWPSPVLKYVAAGFEPDHQWQFYPYAWTVLNRGVNQVYTGQVPQVKAELPKSYKDSHPKTWEETARRHTAWGQGIMYHIVNDGPENPFLDAQNQQLGLGLACLSYPLDYDAYGTPPDHGRETPEEQEAWDAFERHRESVIPWRVESYHPTWVFFEPRPMPRNIIIERPVSLADMARDYPKLGLDPTTASGAKTATFVEFCSAKHYGCFVNGQNVTPGATDEESLVENTAGHMWYQMAWSGFGKADRERRWERIGVGLIQRGIGEFKALTIDDNWIAVLKQAYMPKLIAANPLDGREAAQEETEDLDLRKAGVAAVGTTTLNWLENPNVPPGIIMDVKERQQRLAQLYGPDTLSGTYQSEPASKQASRVELARAPYRAPKKNMEQAWANMLSDMLWDVKHEPDLTGGVGVSYRKTKEPNAPRQYADLKPDEVVLGVRWTVDATPETPEQKAFKVEDAIQKQTAGWYGTERAMKEGAEIEDPVEELAAIAADKVMLSDGYTAIQLQIFTQTLQGLGMLPMAPQPGAGPPGVVPPEPGPGAGMMQGIEPPLPPGVPQQPQPALASPQAAQQQARSAFTMPANPGNGANGRGAY